MTHRPQHRIRRNLVALTTRAFALVAGAFLVCPTEASAFQDSRTPVEISASIWPGADKLFRTDPRWRGCETAVSLKLADGRILWMFGESRIDPAQSGTPDESMTIHNSLALQIGTDPETAELVHFWDITGRRPGPFFKDGSGFWYWPADGIQIGSSLLLLLFKVRPGKSRNAPEIAEWSVARIINPQDSPARWRMQWLPTPANQFDAVLGFGGLVQIGGYIVTGARLREEPDELFLVRWPLDRIVRYDFTTPQWWTQDKGWVVQEAMNDDPSPVASDLDGTVLLSWNPMRDRAFIFGSRPDQPEVIFALQAQAPTGPWTEPKEIFSLETDGVLDRVSLSLCRGLRSDEIVLSAVPVSLSSRSGAFPRLLRITTR